MSEEKANDGANSPAQNASGPVKMKVVTRVGMQIQMDAQQTGLNTDSSGHSPFVAFDVATDALTNLSNVAYVSLLRQTVDDPFQCYDKPNVFGQSLDKLLGTSTNAVTLFAHVYYLHCLHICELTPCFMCDTI